MSKIIFSGVQPSGLLHLGNYLGAIKQWTELQKEADEAIFCIVDLHAITVPQDPLELRKNILSLAAIYIAAGVDPNKSIIFVQSSRPEHAELAWVLNTIPTMGMLARMTQFKEKSKKIKEEEFSKFGVKLEEINDGEDSSWITAPRYTPLGLFTYPVLMAADILLYQTTDVPVGEDQKQHVEFTQSIAKRFNNVFNSEVFTIPKPIIQKSSARIMGLDDPTKKMSKSASSPLNYISLLDDPETIRTKIRKAVTDSGSEIAAKPEKPAVTNLLNIFSEVSGKSVSDLEKEFQGKNYGQFKQALAEATITFLEPLQSKYQELIGNEKALIEILNNGSKKLESIAKSTLENVYKAVGVGI